MESLWKGAWNIAFDEALRQVTSVMHERLDEGSVSA